MIPRYKINTLTDEEYGFLTYCLSEVYPPKPIKEVNHSILSAYDKNHLIRILDEEITPKLKESAYSLLESIKQKLCST